MMLGLHWRSHRGSADAARTEGRFHYPFVLHPPLNLQLRFNHYLANLSFILKKVHSVHIAFQTQYIKQI
jgi:hypothetical protein